MRRRKTDQALQGIDRLINYVDCLIEIPNQKIYEISKEKIGNTSAAYKLLNDEIKRLLKKLAACFFSQIKKI